MTEDTKGEYHFAIKYGKYTMIRINYIQKNDSSKFAMEINWQMR